MPPPKKLDLIPAELRIRLAGALTERGYSDIVEVTEELNFWLEEEGLQLTIGKTAVGKFSKVLKNQHDAFAMAEVLLEDMDVERESDMHRMLMHMIATAAAQMMRSVTEDGGELDTKDLMNLGRMLKDLMGSAGIREKLNSDERKRVADEAREVERAALESLLKDGVARGDVNVSAANAALEAMGMEAMAAA